ncbi:hypothetical protein [Actinopolymorpha pittospori]|uniref:WXG100 family type VII secretion target n=1 Tax=Actinopolymorpha pittospori TaxID=648752 RepID=A0A927N1S2_9ACTN|nr:hypothetical protein [Actinopolymorpha pittospori]MBE1610454.1 hypothetical protein [Actinopolymorpha pittospori]
MNDFPTDEFEKTEHAKILGKLVNWWSNVPETETDTETTPSQSSTYSTKTLWQNVGTQADTLAQDLSSGLKTLLDGGDGSWEGDASEEFRKTVEQIVRFTREIAHTADSKYPKPTGGAEESDSNFQSGTSTKSFAQVFTDVDDQLTATLKEEALPAPPFYETPYWPKWWWDFDNISYEIRKGTGDGSVITPPGRSAEMDYDEFAGGDSGTGGVYGEAQVQVEKDWDGIFFGFLPKNDAENNKLMTFLKFNKDEEATCRESAKTLLEKYGDANQNMPTPPTGLKLTFQSGDQGAFGGGGGGAGMPDMPTGDGAKKPELPDGGLPDRDGDGIPDSQDKYPDDPTRGGGDPKLPENPNDPNDLPKVPNDRDGDGIPDSQDKYPEDPDNGGNSFPDLPTRDSDGDGIPDTSDPFPDDPTRGGGGSGGLPGDIDTGTSTARAGGGGGGIGSLPGGMGGGPPAGGGIPGGGGLAGGAVPLGLPPGSINAGGVGTGGVNGIGGAAAGPGAMRGGMGGMMPPMGGGGGMAAQDGEEQGRTTWLDEDEDVWGGNDDDAPPPVLGGGF